MGKGSAQLKSSPAQLATQRRYYLRNLERRRAAGRIRAAAWFAAHREEANAKRKARYAAQRHEPGFVERRREQVRASAAKKKAERDAVATRPKPDRCEVCGSTGNKDGIVWDHCHASGHFRGWLCAHCNLILGLVRDDAERLRKLADYVKEASLGKR